MKKEEVQAPVVVETQEQALNVLVSAVKLATKRGAFELEETELLVKAIKLFMPNDHKPDNL